MMSAGIVGIAVGMPDVVRKSEEFPAPLVARWREVAVTEGSRDGDPFFGARERRVLPDDEALGVLEKRVGAAALAEAGVAAKDIQLLVANTTETQLGAVYPLVHRELALPPSCQSLATHTSLPKRLSMMAEWVADHRGSHALSVESIRTTPFLDDDHFLRARAGMGAAAFVVGEVAPGRGLLATAERFDRAIAAQRSTLGPSQAALGVHAVLTALDARVDEVLDRALATAKLVRDDVGFFVTDQDASWRQHELRDQCGLSRAATIDTLSWAGDLKNAGIDVSLGLAVKDGLVKDETVIAIVAHDVAGGSLSVSILRWGR